jgi:ATP-dependent Clp protease ATP-binding subunit ClpX
MDGVELDFDNAALEAISDEALSRKTGARGLRAIMEELMLGVMYDIPSRDDIVKCLVNRDTIVNKQPPELELGEGGKKSLKKTAVKKNNKLKKDNESVS